MGAEWRSEESPWRFQTLVEYDYLPEFSVNGDIYEFGLPTHNALSYEYKILNQRVSGELKVLRKWGPWYPYVTGIAGMSWNKAKNYKETSSIVEEVARDPFSEYAAGFT